MAAVEAWATFGACAALIGLAGPQLSRSGDLIAGKLGMSGSWIGIVMIASVTSLPELVTGASAVTVADAPNIAVGDVFGSCVLNLLLLVVLDFLQRGESVYRRARQGHVLSAGFGIVLIGFAGLGVLMRDDAAALAIGHVGIHTPVIALLYVLAMRSVFIYEREQREAFAEAIVDRHPEITLRMAFVRYAMAALVIVGAGGWLPFAGVRLAEAMGWDRTFVGTLLVATATSLPELVVTIAALRIGALDLAIANVLGSNLFNIAILAFDDVLYGHGPLLAHVSPMHAVSAMSAMVMTGIVVVGLLYRPRRRVFGAIGWVSLALAAMYLFNAFVLYLHGD